MTQKELTKYLRGKKTITNLLLAILFFACAVGALGVGSGLIEVEITGGYKTGALVLGVLFAVVGCFSIVDALGGSDLKRQLENLEKQGTLGGLLEDFERGKKFCKGKMIVGNTYVLGKGTNSIVRIDELARVYEYKHTTNGSVDGHSVMGIMKNGSRRELGDIKGIEKSGDQIVDIFNALYVRNGNIQFGYK